MSSTSFSARSRRPAVVTVLISVGLILSGLFAVAPPAGAAAVWTITQIPHSADSLGDILSGVACPSPTSCFAVGNETTGYMVDGLLGDPLIEHWDGQNWSLMSAPTSANWENSELLGLACSGVSNCFAVGDFSSFDSSGSLIEHWNGHRWALMSGPNVTAAKDASLTAVTCSSASNCVAVGLNNIGANGGLIERWNGRHWSLVSSPNISYSGLWGVDCPSAANCFAVGRTEIGPLAERWNGKRWSRMTIPNSSTSGVLDAFDSVACVSGASCFAVGTFETNADGFVPAVEHWDGRVWSSMVSPNQPSQESALFGVACPSAKSCLAVGDSSSSSALAEHWDGKSWSLMTTPTRADGAISLAAVACAKPTACFAVGGSDRGVRTQESLVERYG